MRRAFETLDVCVFTLGLTESWVSLVDGAIYPLCPGTAGGSFDPASHAFHNLSAADVTADHVMRVFLRHFTDAAVPAACLAGSAGPDWHTEAMKALVQVVCDEEILRQA